MLLPPGATPGDVEKRDRNMAKVIIDSIGLEPEKYRLGYTKVGMSVFLFKLSSDFFGCFWCVSIG